jgi:hypothetical protein
MQDNACMHFLVPMTGKCWQRWPMYCIGFSKTNARLCMHAFFGPNDWQVLATLAHVYCIWFSKTNACIFGPNYWQIFLLAKHVYEYLMVLISFAIPVLRGFPRASNNRLRFQMKRGPCTMSRQKYEGALYIHYENYVQQIQS